MASASRRALLLALCISAVSIPRAGLPTGVKLKTFYDTDAIKFSAPVYIGLFPPIAGAFLIGEARGALKVLEPDGAGYKAWTFATLPAAFFSGNDGLVGVAFHPKFADNGRYYACYNPIKGRLILEERTATADRRGDAGVNRELLRLDLTGVVHQGGDIHFGPDGYLYLGIGDGGNPQIYNNRSRDSTLLFGKMLRMDVDRKDAGKEYAIPADNPWAASANPAVRKEVWASGLRQPWRWSFDVDGRLIAGDVGDWVHEEVSVIRKGGDYGWSRVEGMSCFNKDSETNPLASCDTAGLVPPALIVPHVPISTGSNACIIGGRVFRGDAASPFYGAYIFGDYQTGRIYGAPFAVAPKPGSAPEQIGTGTFGLSTFGMDALGNLYVAQYHSGLVYRLDHPDLVGKGVGIRPHRRALRPSGPGRARLLRAADFPGARGLDLRRPDGSLARRYSRAQLEAGIAVDLPAGIYLGDPGAGAEPALVPVLP